MNKTLSKKNSVQLLLILTGMMIFLCGNGKQLLPPAEFCFGVAVGIGLASRLEPKKAATKDALPVDHSTCGSAEDREAHQLKTLEDWRPIRERKL